MSFVLDALRDRPVGLFMMDDSSPLQDYSGYNANATITGTPATVPGFVKGTTYAPVFTSTVTAAYDSKVFKKNLESEPFTLGAVFRVVTSGAEQQVLGNPGQLDGITVAGTVVNFVTKFTTAAEARCSYDIGQYQAVTVFGVHTDSKNSLYVNGVLVDEVTLTDVQMADTFASTGTQLSTGATSGSQTIAVNAVSMYARALTVESIFRQYTMANKVQSARDIVQYFGGDYIPVDTSNAVLFADTWYSTETQWNAGQFFNTAVQNDQLVPQFDSTGTSMPGTWMSSFNLDSGTPSIYGVSLNWDGHGATVSVSLDGTTWETVTRGTNVNTVPAGTVPANQMLHIKVAFAGGVLNDESYIDNLNVIGFVQGAGNVVAGRTPTVLGGNYRRPNPYLIRHDNWGTILQTGGTLTVSTDTSAEATKARTVELWVKRTSSTNLSINVSGTVYQNGVANATALVLNQWTLFHIVSATDITTDIVITGPGQIGHVAVYPTSLSAGNIANIYAAYGGNNAQRVLDASQISVTEVASPTTTYAHDWAIKSAG